jgi:hypothetical protein
MYAGNTTFCIHVPMLDANAPYQTRRKSRDASAARTVPALCGLSLEGVLVSVIEIGKTVGNAADNPTRITESRYNQPARCMRFSARHF